MPIPGDHAQGLFWYHAHFHPRVNTEIAGGLSGGLIIGDILAPLPELAGIPERVMLLERHVLHIHQLDFQVTEMNGEQQPFTGYQDTIDLPPATKRGGPGFAKVIIPFTNPVIVGEFVYHCHIVQHADQGMMANILVVDPAKPPPDIVRCAPPGS
jgi:FtsP/CotA-like multicopper oxidase with cupredoxin domain